MNRNNLKKFPLRKVLALVLCYLSLAACSKNSPEEEPKTVFVYNKDFAHRFGLDESKAIDLDPNLYAIALTFKKSYSFMYDQTDPFVLRYHLNHLTAEQGEMVNSHLAVYPILFPQQKKPLFFSYQCYLNLYFKSSSPILH